MTVGTRVSDEELVSKCKTGDEAAFNELIERYKKMAFSMAYSMTNSVEEAEDISQEAFVTVYTRIHKFREQSSFRTWFYKIVLNLCRNHYRKKKVISIFYPGRTGREGEEKMIEAHSDKTPYRLLRSRQISYTVYAVLGKLPRRQREIFVMKHFEGMKINEISVITGCTEGAVKSHLFRAVKKLQCALRGV